MTSAYDQLAAAQARIDAVGEAALNMQAKFQQREAELLADNARLREELNTVYKLYPDLAAIMAPSALAATPAQSLTETKPAYDENEFQEMVKRGTAAWSDVADASQWLEDLRGGNSDRDELRAQKEGQ